MAKKTEEPQNLIDEETTTEESMNKVAEAGATEEKNAAEEPVPVKEEVLSDEEAIEEADNEGLSKGNIGGNVPEKPSNEEPPEDTDDEDTPELDELYEQTGKPSKAVRKTLISFVVLFILVGAGGFAYTWYTDRNVTPSAQTTAAPVYNQTSEVRPPKISPNAQESAAVELLDSPVAAGQQASITVKTNPDSTCKIKVVYAQTIQSKAAGLTNQTADDYGEVSWTWTVDKTAPAGSWPVTVFCVYHGRSAQVIDNLQVTN